MIPIRFMVLPPLHLLLRPSFVMKGASTARLVLAPKSSEIWLVCSSSHANSRQGMKDSEYIQEPQHNSDHDNAVENGLDTSGHGDKTIHQPKEKANDDQSQ